MSLHAQLTPEAEAALATQKRNSTITAIIIALLALVLIGLILMTIALVTQNKDTPPLVSYQGNPDAEEKLEKPEVKNAVSRKPSSPSASSTRVITAATSSPMAVPVPDFTVDNPSPEFGDGDDFGDGWGDGDGDGFGAGGWGSIPSSMAKRCSKQDRLSRLKKTGGSPACEDAVVKALDWFQKTQNADGSWCNSKPVAMTGLALLAYLGHCETPLSPKYGETVEKAIVYLVSISSKAGLDGKLSSDMADKHWVYEHAIATYALAEAYTFCNIIDYEIPGLMETVQQAGDIMIAGQQTMGGWDYSFANSKRKDMSITCWCLQALKACKATGIGFKGIEAAGRNGLNILGTCQAANGEIGYKGPSNTQLHSLTGAGLLCFYQWKDKNSPVARKAKKWVVENVKYNNTTERPYAHYYHGQALIEVGGKAWDNYNATFRDEALKLQNEDGSFAASGPLSVRSNGYKNHYRTALYTLMLEVYYRFLPSDGK